MKTAICYYSRHHGNTLNVLEAMADERDLENARKFYREIQARNTHG